MDGVSDRIADAQLRIDPHDLLAAQVSGQLLREARPRLRHPPVVIVDVRVADEHVALKVHMAQLTTCRGNVLQLRRTARVISNDL